MGKCNYINDNVNYMTIKNFTNAITMPLHEGNLIRGIIKERGLRQEDVARELGISRNQFGIVLKDEAIKPKYRQPLMVFLGLTEADMSVRELTMAEDAEEPFSPYNARERSNGGKENMWVVPIRAQAGFVKGFMKRLFPHQIQRVSFPMINGECFCFEVEGFSMYPAYLPGSFVVCTILEDMEWMAKNKAYAFQSDEGISVKLYEGMDEGMIKLASENPSYNPVAPMPIADLRQVYVIEFVIDRPGNRPR